jgi:hypothetical protein
MFFHINLLGYSVVEGCLIGSLTLKGRYLCYGGFIYPIKVLLNIQVKWIPNKNELDQPRTQKVMSL